MDTMPPAQPRFVYHRVPFNLTGSMLYPLNRLKEVHPDAAATHIRKYDGRAPLLNRTIPLLNCLWNDVLHLSPVHPDKIKAAMAEAGHIFRPWRWFEIDTALLAPSDTVIWEYRRSDRVRGDFTISEDEILPFAPSLLDHYSEVGERTRRYYASVPPGGRFLIFVGIAHVLYRGSLNIARVSVIEA